MNKIRFTTLLLILELVFTNAFGQTETIVKLETATGDIEGTLLIPDTDKPGPVALIIAGSGPTDRDGNNIQMKNNSLKMLAEGLAENGIASLRYDKRGVGKSFTAGMKEIDLRFDFYVDDAKGWVNLLDKDNRFDDIIIIGHSEGSLIGMIISQQDKVDKYISIAGAGEPAGIIIRKQLKAQPPIVLEQSLPILEKLEKGETVDSVPPMLFSLFRPSVQPYIISWFKHDPRKEIARLDKPVLIIQGSTDIQVTIEDADNLAAANPVAQKHIIVGMNHILKEAEIDRMKNLGTYSMPDLPLKDGLIELIVNFIMGNNED